MFFARDRSAARWYAVNFGDDEPAITEYRLNIINPARERNLLKAVKNVGATEDDIRKHSNYEGYNQSDYLYVPSVVSELKKKGFDGYIGWDTLSNDDIQIAVPFSLNQIKPVKAEMHIDPLLNAIGCTIGVGCLASGDKPIKSKKPVCDGIQKTKRESCIVDVKAKLPAGCNSKNWNKPEGEKPENCVNPFAICTQAVGCRIKKAKLQGHKMKSAYERTGTCVLDKDLRLHEYGCPKKGGKFRGVSVGRDRDGFFITTHRARSKSYLSIKDIPQKTIRFIESTG
jgi:hypothetical protein